MKNLKIILITLTILILTVCGSKAPNNINTPKLNKYPNWYNISDDNNQYIFSLGMGLNKDKAVVVALKNAISKLSISIESSFEKNKTILKG